MGKAASKYIHTYIRTLHTFLCKGIQFRREKYPWGGHPSFLSKVADVHIKAFGTGQTVIAVRLGGGGQRLGLARRGDVFSPDDDDGVG